MMALEISRKYPVWGHFLKSARQKIYRSARDFCAKEEVGISYPQYSRYEAGDQLPHLDQAVKLCKLLNIPLLVGILQWARVQITDEDALVEVSRFLSELCGENSNKIPGLDLPRKDVTSKPLPGLSLDDIFVFNRSHLELFRRNPRYRELFACVYSSSGRWMTVAEICRGLENGHELSEAEVSQLLDDLYQVGVFCREQDCYRTSKSNYYYPDDAEFFELRNQNLKQSMDQVLNTMTFEDLSMQRAFRTVLSVQLSADKRQELMRQLDQIMEKTLSMGMRDPENPQPLYSLCLLMGQQFGQRGESAAEAKLTPTSRGLTVNMKNKEPSQNLANLGTAQSV